MKKNVDYVDGRHRNRWRKHNSYVGRQELKSYSKRWRDIKNLVFATNKHFSNTPCSCCWNIEKITTYRSRMWGTMHCCNIWFGNSISNSIRRKTKTWQHLYTTLRISSWNRAVSCLRSIYCRIWQTSHTKRMSYTCQRIYQIISNRQKLQTL